MGETIRDTFKHIHLLSLLSPICYAHALLLSLTKRIQTHTNAHLSDGGSCSRLCEVDVCVWDSRREQRACLALLSCMARQAAASHWLSAQWEPDCTHCTLPTSKTCDTHNYQTEDEEWSRERHQMSAVAKKFFLGFFVYLFCFFVVWTVT